jgi:hypothetical protein
MIYRDDGLDSWMDTKDTINSFFEDAKEYFPNRTTFEIWVKVGKDSKV